MGSAAENHLSSLANACRFSEQRIHDLLDGLCTATSKKYQPFHADKKVVWSDSQQDSSWRIASKAEKEGEQESRSQAPALTVRISRIMKRQNICVIGPNWKYVVTNTTLRYCNGAFHRKTEGARELLR
jgi:hypothetical protein